MCFSRPKVPDAPPVPNADAEEARARRANELAAQESQRGRAATIITSPLGDPSYGKNVNRVQLAGF